MIDEIDKIIGAALGLSKDGQTVEALGAIASINREELGASQLRKLALIYSYCSQIDACASVWDELTQKFEVKSGDYFMLGSAQLSLSRFSEAATSFRRELDNTLEGGADYYGAASKISLAFCMLKMNNPGDAKAVLLRLDPDASFILIGEGKITRQQLLKMAASMLES